jgi:hypothetical protein
MSKHNVRRFVPDSIKIRPSRESGAPIQRMSRKTGLPLNAGTNALRVSDHLARGACYWTYCGQETRCPFFARKVWLARS